jgi:hypothetical protein
MDLYNVLPNEVKEKFGRHLAKEDEELSNIEGQHHLEAMLMELRLYYRAVETALCNTPPSQAVAPKAKRPTPPRLPSKGAGPTMETISR